MYNADKFYTPEQLILTWSSVLDGHEHFVTAFVAQGACPVAFDHTQ